jgi:hypothetical protein
MIQAGQTENHTIQYTFNGKISNNSLYYDTAATRINIGTCYIGFLQDICISFQVSPQSGEAFCMFNANDEINKKETQ